MNDQVGIFKRRVARRVAALSHWSAQEFQGRMRKIDSLVHKLGYLKQNFGHFDDGI